MTESRGDHLIEVTTGSSEQTVRLGRRLAGRLRTGDVVALIGPLGAGKTQLVRGLAGGLGGDERAISSPTFVLMQEYETTPPLLHIDAYRIGSLGELETVGWTDELAADSVTAIEWADRIAGELPADRLTIELEHAGDEERRLTFRGGVGWRVRLDGLEGPAPSAPAAPRPATDCPICNEPVDASSATYPFCSPRCRMVDLGRWLGGDYRLPREVDWEDDDLSAFEREDEDEA